MWNLMIYFFEMTPWQIIVKQKSYSRYSTEIVLKIVFKKTYFLSLWWCHLFLFLIYTITVQVLENIIIFIQSGWYFDPVLLFIPWSLIYRSDYPTLCGWDKHLGEKSEKHCVVLFHRLDISFAFPFFFSFHLELLMKMKIQKKVLSRLWKCSITWHQGIVLITM